MVAHKCEKFQRSLVPTAAVTVVMAQCRVTVDSKPTNEKLWPGSAPVSFWVISLLYCFWFLLFVRQ